MRRQATGCRCCLGLVLQPPCLRVAPSASATTAPGPQLTLGAEAADGRGSSSAAYLMCQGPCMRAFHTECLTTLCGLEAVIGAGDGHCWSCPECATGRMRCCACGGLGAGLADPLMRRCRTRGCGRFYHPE